MLCDAVLCDAAAAKDGVPGGGRNCRAMLACLKVVAPWRGPQPEYICVQQAVSVYQLLGSNVVAPCLRVGGVLFFFFFLRTVFVRFFFF